MTSLSKNDVQENNTKVSPYRPVSEKWKKVLLVFNPVAGRSEIRTELVDILETLSADSYLVTCYPTKCQGDARHIVRTRKGDYTYVICSGGDGTLDEVVSGMMENKDKPVIPIGYIPAGTTNDFATSLGIPSNKKEAARIAARGKVLECDLGKFNDDMYFTYVAAFGLFTETSYETPQDLKNLFGPLAYFMQGMMDLGRIRNYRIRVETEEMSISGEFVFGMITNSKSVGGFADITGNQVDMSDGLFEVTLVKMPANPLDLSDILQYLSRNSNSSDLVYQFKTSHIVFECSEKVKWTRDGEYAGSYSRVEITNLRRAMKILDPREGVKGDTENGTK